MTTPSVPLLFDAIRSRNDAALAAYLVMYKGVLPIVSTEGRDLLEAAVHSGSRSCVMVLLRSGYDPRPLLSRTDAMISPGCLASMRSASARWATRPAATERLACALQRHDVETALVSIMEGARVSASDEDRRFEKNAFAAGAPFLSQAARVALATGDDRVFFALLASGAPPNKMGFGSAGEPALDVVMGRVDTPMGEKLVMALLACPDIEVSETALARAMVTNTPDEVLLRLREKKWQPCVRNLCWAVAGASPGPVAWLLANATWSTEDLRTAERHLVSPQPGCTPERIAATAALLLRCPQANPQAQKPKPRL